jgi:uncharacterized protein YecE (DUF72 family)
MKFGKVDHPELVDFTLPKDHPGTEKILKTKGYASEKPEIFVGCAKWNRTDLKGFYPRGTKDELVYYASQFNSIELNATFYRLFPNEQFVKWKDKTPEGFRFFPKITQNISHLKRLLDFERMVDEYAHAVRHLEDKLGVVFLQMHQNFAPKDFERVEKFAKYWPKDIPLTMEFRHPSWFEDEKVANELYALLEEYNISNTLVDTAGRRDLMHMRLTTPWVFIRYTGANVESDYTRLDDWVIRLKKWADQGLKGIYFFVHQNLEKESPLLSAHFIKNVNATFGSSLKIPNEEIGGGKLF